MREILEIFDEKMNFLARVWLKIGAADAKNLSIWSQKSEFHKFLDFLRISGEIPPPVYD